MNISPTMVVGLGDTGVSVIRHLRLKDRAVAVCDSRLGKRTREIPHLLKVRRDYPDVSVIPPRQFARAVARSKRVVASPGIAIDDTLLKFATIERVPIVGDIDLFMEEVDVPVVGITGTNGKSTTAMLVGAMLQDREFKVCGNIGLPVLDALDSGAKGFVVELSSFQLERLQNARFDVAAITNIAEDHLDRHKSLDEYVSSKRRVYDNCKFAVFNGLDNNTRPESATASIAINGSSDWCVEPDGVVVNGSHISAEQIALQGRHNYFNLVMAAAIASRFGATDEVIREVASTFTGLQHRTQFVAQVNGADYFNDSKATNVAASIASISSMSADSSKLILIAGGDGKSVDFQQLGATIDKCVSHLVLIGQDAEAIANCTKLVSCSFASSMDEAVRIAQDHASAGDRVLLSPACASFDMFRNFEHRGDAFAKAVVELQS
ncbi:MAG: UDP-N-acetylmuramoyl-L-alanine--D-glutamate ligase [Gammaproteobacteria bacterium]|nr:UDP-N-acetylmuramoyl-L-alanine--D-glutamate ligase [Gammaproteobacteria bacterium]